MVDTTNFPNSVTGKAANEERSRFRTGAGGIATDIADAISAKGVPITPTPASLTSDSVDYSANLDPGVYTRADLLTLSGVSEILSISVTCLTGTMDIAQGGSVLDHPAGSVWVQEYHPGYTVSDFTLTVDAASSVSILIRGQA